MTGAKRPRRPPASGKLPVTSVNSSAASATSSAVSEPGAKAAKRTRAKTGRPVVVNPVAKALRVLKPKRVESEKVYRRRPRTGGDDPAAGGEA